MKYLLVFSEVFSKGGGIPTLNRQFLKALFQIKEDNQYIALLLNDKKAPSLFKSNSKIKFICCGKTPLRVINKIILCINFIWLNLVQDPRVNFIGHVNIAPLALFAKYLLGKQYIIITHGIEVWDIKSKIKKKAFKKAFLIVSVSHFTQSKIKQQVILKDNKFFLLPNTVDVNRLQPKPKNLSLIKKYKLEGNKIILTVARLATTEKNKGYDKVIKALPYILKQIPNVKYLIVGRGDDIPRVKNLAVKLEVREKVIFTGFVSEKELPDYYNLCDVFVMPSKKEGFGIVFLEALACGKPVIAGKKDASREPLLDGELGILVDPDNVDEITNAIIRVLKKEVPERLLDSRYLRKRACEVYGFDKFKNRVRNLILSLK
ncbi:glycosyltransferase family 4 protein [Patescibacteria group bacterium]|nr:glycosyltransferase family 4 protein [Patescibacteria group bacterium]